MNLPALPLLNELSTSLVQWFLENHRPLPWRESRDPYRIWISEIMLQQTTVNAVVPYYERFMAKYPTVTALAKSPLPEVLKLWTGLGYYSRARNLHAAAQLLAKQQEFPRSYKELLELPGLGPYTARAVASLAFGEAVGVLDGNVIRVLSRVLGLPVEHWTQAGRNFLQSTADLLAQQCAPDLVNSGLMELGATICTPRAYSCLLCPWVRLCEGRRKGKINELPLMKPRRKTEIWIWRPRVYRRNKNEVGLVLNHYAPFLRNQWIFPGNTEQVQSRPKNFDLRHGITHHDIYVRLSNSSTKMTTNRERDLVWVPQEKLTEKNPSILLQKVLTSAQDPLFQNSSSSASSSSSSSST